MRCDTQLFDFNIVEDEFPNCRRVEEEEKQSMATTDVDNLIKEIECLMCLNLSSDCRMCIHCSAILCRSCLENWFQQRTFCPKCSKFIEEKDFISNHLAAKLIEFLDSPRFAKCEKHSKETPRLHCSTCQTFICLECVLVDGQHVEHDFQFMDETFRRLLALNHKYLTFFRQRISRNEDEKKTIETATELLLGDHGEELVRVDGDPSRTDRFIKETENLFNKYQMKNESCHRTIEADQSVVNHVEQRLKTSRTQLDQEEILQMFQRRIIGDE